MQTGRSEKLPKVRDFDDPDGLGLRNIYVAFFLLAISKCQKISYPIIIMKLPFAPNRSFTG